MKLANLVVGTLYSVFLAALVVVAVLRQSPYQVIGTIFLAGPVVVNWLSFSAWNTPASKIKVVNLVIAIIYTPILIITGTTGPGGVQHLLGSVMFVAPTLLNWLSYLYWPNVTVVTANETPYSTGQKSLDRADM